MINFDLETVQETLGDCDHSRGYSIYRLADFFHEKYEDGWFSYQPLDKKLMWRVSESLKFNVALHLTVVDQLQGIFTTNQLTCIFQCFNGSMVRYDGRLYSLKQGLYEYIDNEGIHIYDLGDVDEFKRQLEAINPIVFAVFVDIIIEAWGSRDARFGLSSLLDALKNN